ncbi:hypothetical protein TNCV_1344651 [Trichonephila clavipes]|nr:hypothetical protein TNCV_1344651 [Trichonephila clavipes]
MSESLAEASPGSVAPIANEHDTPFRIKLRKPTLDLNPIAESSISAPYSRISPKNDSFKFQGRVHYTPLVTSHWQRHKSLHTALGLISVLFEWNSQSSSLVLLECTGTRLPVRTSGHFVHRAVIVF